MNTDDTRPRKRSTLARWVSPDADSTWAALWVSTVVWTVLAVLWLLYLVLADVETYRLVLYPVLILVAVLQVLTNAATMRRKRIREGRG